MIPQDIPEISLVDARARLDAGETLFVDIRDPHSYDTGHIPGAVHLTDRNVSEFLESTSRDRQVVVYCYHGHSSMSATAWLMQQGFSDVVSMTGGFTAWQFNHPVEAGQG